MDTKVIVTSELQLKEIVSTAVDTALKNHPLMNAPVTDSSPFGDLEWLYSVWPIPKDTIEQMSAKNKIPGKIKIGKRVIYDKVETLNWIRSHKCSVISLSEIEQSVNNQFNKQQSKKSPKF